MVAAKQRDKAMAHSLECICRRRRTRDQSLTERVFEAICAQRDIELSTHFQTQYYLNVSVSNMARNRVVHNSHDFTI